MNKTETFKHVITNLLLVFVLITIGYSLGKHNTLAEVTVDANPIMASNASSAKMHVRAYYMHSTFRCVTCNDIEAKALAIVDKEFAAQKADDTLSWVDVNFQENESLAKRFDVAASCIVVAVMRGNEIVSFARLDEVWTLVEKPQEFAAYVRNAFNQAFAAIKGA